MLTEKCIYVYDLKHFLGSIHNIRIYKKIGNVKYYYIELKKFRSQNPDMNEPLNQWLALLDMERGDLLDMAKEKNAIRRNK